MEYFFRRGRLSSSFLVWLARIIWGSCNSLDYSLGATLFDTLTEFVSLDQDSVPRDRHPRRHRRQQQRRRRRRGRTDAENHQPVFRRRQRNPERTESSGAGQPEARRDFLRHPERDRPRRKTLPLPDLVPARRRHHRSLRLRRLQRPMHAGPLKAIVS